MPVQRKVFRIEERTRPRVAEARSYPQDALSRHDAPPRQDVMREPQALRELMQPHAGVDRDALERARAQIAEAQAYNQELGLIYAAVERTRQEMIALGVEAETNERTSRAGRELAAIAGGTERATQSILQAAEDIDQAALALSGSAKTTHEKGLAQDIQDRVMQIFEACNFQDLTGQRVNHVLETLQFVEEHLARLLDIWRDIEGFKPVVLAAGTKENHRFLNGPKLPGDAGHFNQDDIDRMFRRA